MPDVLYVTCTAYVLTEKREKKNKVLLERREKKK